MTIHESLYQRFTRFASEWQAGQHLVTLNKEEAQYLADILRAPDADGILVNAFNLIYGDFNFWTVLTGIIILDPDGWDRSNPDSFNEMISFQEFLVRACKSTVGNVKRLMALCELSRSI